MAIIDVSKTGLNLRSESVTALSNNALDQNFVSLEALTLASVNGLIYKSWDYAYESNLEQIFEPIDMETYFISRVVTRSTAESNNLPSLDNGKSFVFKFSESAQMYGVSASSINGWWGEFLNNTTDRIFVLSQLSASQSIVNTWEFNSLSLTYSAGESCWRLSGTKTQGPVYFSNFTPEESFVIKYYTQTPVYYNPNFPEYNTTQGYSFTQSFIPSANGSYSIQAFSNFDLPDGSTQSLRFYDNGSSGRSYFSFFNDIRSVISTDPNKRPMVRMIGRYDRLFQVNNIIYSGSQSNYWTLTTKVIENNGNGPTASGVTMSRAGSINLIPKQSKYGSRFYNVTPTYSVIIPTSNGNYSITVNVYDGNGNFDSLASSLVEGQGRTQSIRFHEIDSNFVSQYNLFNDLRPFITSTQRPLLKMEGKYNKVFQVDGITRTTLGASAGSYSYWTLTTRVYIDDGNLNVFSGSSATISSIGTLLVGSNSISYPNQIGESIGGYTTLYDPLVVPSSQRIYFGDSSTDNLFISGGQLIINDVTYGLTPSGESGPSGPQGESGPSGPQGDLGPSGPTGTIGETGPQGDLGPVGATGSDGPNSIRLIFGDTSGSAPTATGSFNTSGGPSFSDVTIIHFNTPPYTDVNGASIIDWLDNAINDRLASRTINAQISEVGVPSNYGIYTAIPNTPSPNALWDLTFVSGNGTFSADRIYTISVVSGGPIGATGSQGATGPVGPTGAAGSPLIFQSAWQTLPAVYGADEYVTYGGSTWFTSTYSIVDDGIPPSPTNSNWNIFAGAALIVGTAIPDSSSSAGSKGEIRVDNGQYLYIHTGAQWLKSSMTFSTF